MDYYYYYYKIYFDSTAVEKLIINKSHDCLPASLSTYLTD